MTLIEKDTCRLLTLRDEDTSCRQTVKRIRRSCIGARSADEAVRRFYREQAVASELLQAAGLLQANVRLREQTAPANSEAATIAARVFGEPVEQPPPAVHALARFTLRDQVDDSPLATAEAKALAETVSWDDDAPNPTPALTHQFALALARARAVAATPAPATKCDHDFN